jgi:Transglycosylase-like domain
MAVAAAVLALVGVSPDLFPEHPHHPHHWFERRVEPFVGRTTYGGWARYAIPARVVDCESRGETHEQSHPWSSSGLYQIEAGTWTAFGGKRFAALPYLATKLQQSIIAYRILRSQGRGAWSCTWIVGWH